MRIPRTITAGLALSSILASSAWSQMPAFLGVARRHRERVVERFDQDGDDRLNGEERQDLRQTRVTRRVVRGVVASAIFGFEPGDEGGDSEGDVTTEEAEDSGEDLDGESGEDGVGDAGSETTDSEDIADTGVVISAGTTGPRRPGGAGGEPRVLARFDGDGDGKLDESERESLKEARQARRDKVVARFDSDGDGSLTGSERVAARVTRRRAKPVLRARRVRHVRQVRRVRRARRAATAS